MYLILGGNLVGVKMIHWPGNHEVLFTVFADDINHASLGLCLLATLRSNCICSSIFPYFP